MKSNHINIIVILSMDIYKMTSNHLDNGLKSPLDMIHQFESLDDDSIFEGSNIAENCYNTEDIDDSNKKTIKNPFFQSIESSKIPKKDIYGFYKRVLVLCTKEETIIDDQTIINEDELFIFNNRITIDNIKKNKNKYTLVLGDINMVNNKYHYESLLVVEKCFLEIFNHTNISLENNELILLLIDLPQTKATEYIRLYSGSYNMDFIINNYTFLNYYGGLNSSYLQKQLSKVMNRLTENEYWTNSYNCKLTFTDKFRDRNFQLTSVFSKKRQIAALSLSHVKKNSKNSSLFKILEKDNVINNSDGYTKYLTLKKEYNDMSSAIKNGGYNLYNISNPTLLITKTQMTDWFKVMNNTKLRFDMFNALLLSKDYCHMALNNKDILQIMTPIIKKAMPFYKYLFGYSWMYMYLESSIVKTYATKSSRFVFDIDTASNLPFFPYSFDSPYSNPYLSSMLLDLKDANLKKNIMGLKMDKNWKDYGIDTLNNFKRKLNIFTTNSEDSDLFEGLDWSCFAITGSLMSALIPKKSLLTEGVPGNTESEKFKNYILKYYKNSDIDMMCNEKSIFVFMDKVKELLSVLKININNLNNIDESSPFSIVEKRPLTITVHIDYIKTMGDSQDIIKNIKKNRIKDKFFQIYINNKIKNSDLLRTKYKDNNNILYEYFFEPKTRRDMTIIITTDKLVPYESESNIYIKMSDVDKTINPENDFAGLIISETSRFIISSEFMVRDIEIYRSRYKNYFSTVFNHHLGNVTSYYNGENVYMLPEAIVSYMTGINLLYKYIAGSVDPSDIIVKNRKRGYGIVLNTKEINYISNYCKNSSDYKWMFEQNDDGLYKVPFGGLTLKNKLFDCDEDVLDDLSEKQYINNTSDIHEYYHTNYNYNESLSDVKFLRLNTTNNRGYIQPFKLWTLEAAYDYFLNIPY